MKKLFTLLLLSFVGQGAFGQIIATNDFMTGNAGSTVGNVLNDNGGGPDLFNGAPADLNDVEITNIVPTYPDVTIDPVTGDVTVGPDVTSGTYTITYDLCETGAVPANCDAATVTVTVLNPIVAEDDALTGNAGSTVGNVLNDNGSGPDTFNGFLADLADMFFTNIVPSNPDVTIDPVTGNVTVGPNVPSGTYTIDYELCEVGAMPPNCDIAVVTVAVGFIANPDTLTVSPNGTATINVYDNDLNVSNPSDFTIFISLAPVFGTASINQDGTLTYTNTAPLGCEGDSLIYTFCEMISPVNCFEAMVYISLEPTAPIIDNCPGNIIVNNDPGLCGANVFWNPVTASSSCGGQTTLTESASSGNFFPIGSTMVTYTATDPSGNTSVCQFLVTVNDNEAPTCPSNMTLNASPSTCSALVVLPSAFDNCGIVTMSGFWSVPGGLISGGQWPVGVNEVSYDLTDAMSNTVTCNFTVTIIDNIFPTFTSCPENITVDSPNGDPVLVSWDEPVAFDNCSYNTTNFVQYPDGTSAPNIGNTNNMLPVGVSTVNYVTVDVSGNASTCTFNVEVIDLTTGISGTVYLDENQNCVIDGNDLNMSNVLVQLFDDQGAYVAQTITDANGVYQFFVDAGTYSLSIPDPTNGLTVSCPAGGTQNATVVANQMTSDVDFGMFCPGSGFDIALASISKVGWVFPGQSHTLSVLTASLYQEIAASCAGVTDNTSISGDLTISINGPLIYQSIPVGSLTPTSMSGLTFTYNIADFSTIDINSFMLNLGTESSAQSGDLVIVTATFTPNVSGDVNPSNNTLNFVYAVVNSYDPNIKLVSPIGDVLVGYEDDLIYTIYFQNTGDAPAFNITLVDTLSSNLNLLSFEKMDASHDCSVDIMGNVMTIHFPDIMLPDSTSNPEGSIGFFQYKIKPLVGLEEGESIENTAHIFFDFNEAIVTNTTVTTYIVEDESSIDELIFNEMTIFPNPTKGSFTIHLNSTVSGGVELQIMDLAGKTHVQQEVFLTSNTFNFEGTLGSGVYLIQVMDKSTNLVYFGRIIVE